MEDTIERAVLLKVASLPLVGSMSEEVPTAGAGGNSLDASAVLSARAVHPSEGSRGQNNK